MTETVLAPPTRSVTDRKLLGVCAGFAERYGMDPLVIRIAVFVLALFGGLGVVLYLAGAVWLREPGDHADVLTGRRLILLVVAVLAALIVIPGLVVIPFGGDWRFGLVLVLLVLLLLMTTRSSSKPRPATVAPPEPPVVDTTEYAAVPYPAYYPVAEPEPAAPKRRSYLGAMAMGVSVMWFGLAWTLNAVDLTDFSALTIFGVSLAILGGGILIGAWVGRARWLVLFALPLSMVVWGLTAVPSEVRLGDAADWAEAGIGETVFAPTTGNDSAFSWGFGSAELDVAQWTPSDIAQVVDAQVGVGELVILVPSDWSVVVDGEVGAGSITKDGLAVASGPNTAQVVSLPADPGSPRMHIDARVDLGTITIQTQELS